MKERSRYVCARCGLSVYSWYSNKGTVWKHATGWHGPKSCGLPPVPVVRNPKYITN